MDLNLQDKTFVVIGTAGIGLAAAKVLAADGAAVTVIGRDEAKAQNAVSTLSAVGAGAAHGLTYDVSKPGAAIEAVGDAVEKLGGGLHGIAVTICTAGIDVRRRRRRRMG